MRCKLSRLLSYAFALHFLWNIAQWTPSLASNHDLSQTGIRRWNNSGEQIRSHVSERRSHSIIHGHHRKSRGTQHSKAKTKHRPTQKLPFKHHTAHPASQVQPPKNSLHADSDTSGTFLIPLLPYGLSNQILALKEALALAAVLNWTVVPLGFWPHISELAAAAGITLAPGGLTHRGIMELDTENDGENEQLSYEMLLEQQQQAQQQQELLMEESLPTSPPEGLSPSPQPVPLQPPLQPITPPPPTPPKQPMSLQQPTLPTTALTPTPALTPTTTLTQTLMAQPPKQQPKMTGLQPQLHQRESGGLSHAHSPFHLNASSIIPFELVFDRSALAPLVRVISREEAVRQYGWSETGHVDLLLSISPTSGLESTLQKAAQAEVLDIHGSRTVRNHGFSCDASGLSWMTRTAAGHRWVAVYSYRRVVPEARSSYRSFAGDKGACARAYHQVSLRMRKSPLISATARSFVMKAVAELQPQQQPQPGKDEAGGGSMPSSGSAPYYAALHVRPYPDTCLEYFVNMTEFDIDAAEKVCSNPRLLVKMVPLVRQILEARAVNMRRGVEVLPTPAAPPASDPGAATLFVMSHPRVREALRRELRRLWDDGGGSRGGSIGPSLGTSTSSSPPLPALFFLDSSELPSELQSHMASTSLLSMVEQQVCSEAAAFIGTKASSISVLVAQERVAADVDSGDAVGGAEVVGLGMMEPMDVSGSKAATKFGSGGGAGSGDDPQQLTRTSSSGGVDRPDGNEVGLGSHLRRFTTII